MSELLPSLAEAPFCHGVRIGVGVIRKSPLSGGVMAWARAPLPQRQRRAAAAAAAAAARRGEGRSMSERTFFFSLLRLSFFFPRRRKRALLNEKQ